MLKVQTTFGDHGIKEDFDIDLVVRAIDAAGIVNRVGVDFTTLKRVFDAPELSESKVTAFRDDFAAKIFSANALDIPIAFIGYAALSVLRRITRFTPLAVAALQTFSVPSTFVRTASIG